MSRCAYCSSWILFGAVERNGERFCNNNCADGAELAHTARGISDDELEEAINSVYTGNCPKCGGTGPVDVQLSYRIWSLVFLRRGIPFPNSLAVGVEIGLARCPS